MAYLASLAAGAVLSDVFRAYPQIARPLPDYEQALLRSASPLTVAERELIAAYVPGLSARGYGYGVHQATVQTLVFLAVWGPAGHDSEPGRRRGRYPIDVCPAGIGGSHRRGPV